jgi:hypothetical protein
MSDTPEFDLHSAEAAAQAAALWFVLETLLRFALKDMPHAERAELLDRMLDAADAITLPIAGNADNEASAKWIANRYWQLIENFIAKNFTEECFPSLRH